MKVDLVVTGSGHRFLKGYNTKIPELWHQVPELAIGSIVRIYGYTVFWVYIIVLYPCGLVWIHF